MALFWSADFVLQQFPRTPLFFVGLYLFGQLTAFAFSENHITSFVGTIFRYQGLFTNVLYILIFLTATHFFSATDEKIHTKLFIFIGWLGGICSVIALASYSRLFFDPALTFNRVYGTLGQPNYLASLLIVAWPMCLLFKNKFATGLIVTPIFVTLFLTGSRAAWIGALVSTIIVGSVLYRKNQLGKRLFITSACCCLLAVSFLLLNSYSPHKLLQRFSLHGYEQQSVVTRFTLWKAGGHMLLQKPVFGYGQDMLQTTLHNFLPPGTEANNQYFDRIHSEPFDILLSGGIFSAIGYLGLFFSAWYSGFQIFTKKESSLLTTLALLSLTALFIYHLFNFSTITSNIFWYVLLGYMFSREKMSIFVKKS